MPEWLQILAGSIGSAAVLWVFTATTRNRERIVKLETEMAAINWTLRNIDANVNVLVKAEAKRQGREEVEGVS